MSSFFSFLSAAMFCITLLGLTFMVVLSLPKSKMRDVMKNVLMVIGGVLYVLSPIDLLPEIGLGPVGLVDDFAVGIAAYCSALKLWRSDKGAEKVA